MYEDVEERKREVFGIIRNLLKNGTKDNRNIIINKVVDNEDEYDFLEDIHDSSDRRTSLFLVKNKIKFAIDMTQKYLGISPTISEITYMTGLKQEKIREYLRYIQIENATSLEEEKSEDEIIDSLEDAEEAIIDASGRVVTDGVYAEEKESRKNNGVSMIVGSQISGQNSVHNKALKEAINKILNTLNAREKQIIILRFGLKDGIAKSQREVARILGISPARVQQIEIKTLRKLANPLRSKAVRDFLDNPDDDGR